MSRTDATGRGIASLLGRIGTVVRHPGARLLSLFTLLTALTVQLIGGASSCYEARGEESKKGPRDSGSLFLKELGQTRLPPQLVNDTAHRA
jgi:hypothetical protein